jgi:hypothetical protein
VLEAKGLGARRLDLLFHRVDNRIEAVRIGIALPVAVAERRAIQRRGNHRPPGALTGRGADVIVLDDPQKAGSGWG